MALLNWVQVQGFVIVAITGFGPSGHDPARLPDVALADLDGPNTRMVGNVERWDYGISVHEIVSGDVQHLVDWFRRQYPGGNGLQAQAKRYRGAYGGIVLNLVWEIQDPNFHTSRWPNLPRWRRFNFHIKVNQASMDMKTLLASGAKGRQNKNAMDQMFPPLS